jgi:hypothetical protein
MARWRWPKHDNMADMIADPTSKMKVHPGMLMKTRKSRCQAGTRRLQMPAGYEVDAKGLK